MSNVHHNEVAPVSIVPALTALTAKETRAKIAEQAAAASKAKDVEASDRKVTKEDNFKPSEAGKLLNEFLTTKVKEEGISSKLLVAMFKMNETFSNEWLKAYFQIEKGTDRVKKLHDVLTDLLGPPFIELDETASSKPQEDCKDIADAVKRDAAIKKATEAKDDAGRQRKNLQNILRACILALSGVRIANVTELEATKTGKIVFVYKNEKGRDVESSANSFNSMVDMGSNRVKEAKWSTGKSREARPGSNAPANSTKAVRTVTLDAAASYIIGSLSDKDFSKLPEREQAMLRALEMFLIQKHFGDASGNVSGEDVAGYYNGSFDYRNELPKPVSAVEAEQTTSKAA